MHSIPLTPFSTHPDIRSQCTRLPCSATAATRAACVVIGDTPATAQQDASLHVALAALLGNDLSPLGVCIDLKAESANATKMLLQAISNTESRNPRDASAVATILLNLCFTSCRCACVVVCVFEFVCVHLRLHLCLLTPRFRDPSTTTLLAVAATRTPQSRKKYYSLTTEMKTDSLFYLTRSQHDLQSLLHRPCDGSAVAGACACCTLQRMMATFRNTSPS